MGNPTAPSTAARPHYGRFASDRLKIVGQVGKRPHRYRSYRAATIATSVLLLLLVPLVGIARFDVLGGEHIALGDRADTLHGLVAVSVAGFSFFFVTFAVNLFAGRMFCGFGCPVGQINRITDTLRASKTTKQKLLWASMLGLLVVSLSAALVSWWVTPTTLSTWPGILLAPLTAGVLAGSMVAFGRVFGWSFCAKACPIGLYYSLVQQKKPLGILFEKSKCLDELACVKACPVDLDPRDLLELKDDIGGFALDGLPANNHCLRCGLCVEACDLVTSKTNLVALAYGRPERPIEVFLERPDLRPFDVAQGTQPVDAVPYYEPVAPPEVFASTGPKVTWRELILTGGPRGIGGSGLSIIDIVVGTVLASVIFFLWDGPLWNVPLGTSAVPRLVIMTIACPFLALASMATHKRFGLVPWVNASSIVVGGAYLVVSTLYVFLSPGAARIYAPKETWTEATVIAANNAPSEPPYVAATSAFGAGTIRGRVHARDAAIAGALVFVEHPAPGRTAGAAPQASITVGAGGYSPHLTVARAGERLTLANETSKFHTFALSRRGRPAKNVALQPRAPSKNVAAPAPGEYEIACASHPDEHARLVVLDHDYHAFTNEKGEFELTQIPAGAVRLMVVAPGPEGRLVKRIDLTADGRLELDLVLPEPTAGLDGAAPKATRAQ
jgi:ferredoxin/plastocyanin